MKQTHIYWAIALSIAVGASIYLTMAIDAHFDMVRELKEENVKLQQQLENKDDATAGIIQENKELKADLLPFQ